MFAGLEIERSGIYHTEKHIKTADISKTYDSLPDIVRLIFTETLLKCAAVIKIYCDKQHFSSLDGVEIPEEPLTDRKEFKLRC